MKVHTPGGFPTTSGYCNFKVLLNGADAPVAVVEAAGVAEAGEFFEAIRPLVGVECHAPVRLEPMLGMQVGVPRFGRPYLQMLVVKAEWERGQAGHVGH
ncbi:hypothetical protein [Cupriavidus sp. CP313]